MTEILENPIWVTVFICAIAVLCVLIVELNYRLFAKRMLEVIFSGLFIVICSPVLITLAIISKAREGRVFAHTPYLGKNGKIIYLLSFDGIDSGIRKIAVLLDIFLGKVSFVGVHLMSVNDGAIISDEDMERFAQKPGLISNLAAKGSESLTYEESFDLEKKYIKRSELFGDVWIMIKALVYALRGDSKIYLGEVKDKTYGEVLLERGTITEEQYTEAISLAQSALPQTRRL